VPKKQIRFGEKVPLKLTAAQRTLIIDEVTCLDQEYEQAIRDTPLGEPIMMSLDVLEDLGGFIAAEANHCELNAKRSRLDVIFEKIQTLQDRYVEEPDERPPIQRQSSTPRQR
jgi:hypothetical protein